MGNCEVRDHSIVAYLFSLPIQRFQAPQLPIFLIPLYYMLPIFVSKLKFFWNGLANKHGGILPQVGSLRLLLGYHYTNRAHYYFPSHLVVEMWMHPELRCSQHSCAHCLHMETQALLGGCIWGMIMGRWLMLIIFSSW